MSRDASSADAAIAVTPNDSTVLATTRGLYVGVSGDVAVVTKGHGTSVVFKNVPAGILPVRVTKVLSTGTTATDILALY